MRRREFISLVCASVGWPLAAMAQQLDDMRRIGELMGFPNDAQGPRVTAIRQELLKLGWAIGGSLPSSVRSRCACIPGGVADDEAAGVLCGLCSRAVSVPFLVSPRSVIPKHRARWSKSAMPQHPSNQIDPQRTTPVKSSTKPSPASVGGRGTEYIRPDQRSPRRHRSRPTHDRDPR
jgi:hypothetical protein